MADKPDFKTRLKWGCAALFIYFSGMFSGGLFGYLYGRATGLVDGFTNCMLR